MSTDDFYDKLDDSSPDTQPSPAQVVAAAPPGPDLTSPAWPPKPANFNPLSALERDQLFGHIAFRAAPEPGNAEAIQITNDWRAKNLVTATIPQLAKIPGVLVAGRSQGAGPRGGVVQCHRLAVEPFKRLFQLWEDEGLLDLVLTWGGLWNPRFIRGSTSILSNHAYGTAFDICVPWNQLGKQGALVGQHGSVRKLVPCAANLGIYWGGWFPNRFDMMHFELAKDAVKHG